MAACLFTSCTNARRDGYSRIHCMAWIYPHQSDTIASRCISGSRQQHLRASRDCHDIMWMAVAWYKHRQLPLFRGMDCGWHCAWTSNDQLIYLPEMERGLRPVELFLPLFGTTAGTPNGKHNLPLLR